MEKYLEIFSIQIPSMDLEDHGQVVLIIKKLKIFTSKLLD
jgi:hypothetical protein